MDRTWTVVGVGGSPRVPLSGIPGEEDQERKTHQITQFRQYSPVKNSWIPNQKLKNLSYLQFIPNSQSKYFVTRVPLLGCVFPESLLDCRGKHHRPITNSLSIIALRHLHVWASIISGIR
ncbi:unnamed protein product [Lactuca virosa]|uniref:Uncharacterized protein n=1 Tax=Lactuca virosa TaxID=75947 RepID=A0AAU9M8Y4_9ASTR|nr:unnamed protein product [Lactuca virosa]